MLILLTSFVKVADEFSFKPKWKKGDKIHYAVEKVKETIENNTSTDKKVLNMELFVEVVDETKDDFFLEFKFKGFKMEGQDKIKKLLGNDFNLDMFGDIAYRYKLNKESGHHSIDNWQEIATKLGEAFNSIGDAIEAKDPEKGKMVKFMMKMITAQFMEKQVITDIGNKELGPFFFPYQNAHSLEGTTERIDSIYLPFDKKWKEATKSVVKTDKIGKDLYQINVDRFTDLTNYTEMVKKNFKDLAMMMAEEGMNKDSLNQVLNISLENIDYKLDFSVDYIYDDKTSWMTRYVNHMNYISNNASKARTVKETLTVKMIE